MSTDMSSVNNTNRIEVITGVQRRRRWTPEQKLELVKQTFEAGMTVSIDLSGFIGPFSFRNEGSGC